MTRPGKQERRRRRPSAFTLEMDLCQMCLTEVTLENPSWRAEKVVAGMITFVNISSTFFNIRYERSRIHWLVLRATHLGLTFGLYPKKRKAFFRTGLAGEAHWNYASLAAMISSTRSRYLATCLESTLLRRC